MRAGLLMLGVMLALGCDSGAEQDPGTGDGEPPGSGADGPRPGRDADARPAVGPDARSGEDGLGLAPQSPPDGGATPDRADARLDDGGAAPPAPDGGPAAGAAAPGCLAAAADPEWLTARLAELSGARPVQVGDELVRIEERQTAAGRARARAYLRAQWEEVGLRVSEQPYGTGVNLIGERDGTDDRRLLIGAHYDTVRSVPGADDDGSGVIAGLAVARALRGCTLAHGLRLVAFDEEELGTRGSRQNAMALSTAEVGRLIGLIQLEMLAYDSDGDGRFNVIDCAVARDRPLVEALGDPGRLGLVPVSFCTSRSDHQPFLDRGVAAIVLSQHFFDSSGKPDPNPCYHKACDTLDRITVPFFAKMTTLAAEAAARLLGAH